MTLDRLALGCLLPGFEGTRAPDWLRREIAGGLGGVVLFARNVVDGEQVAALAAELRREREDVIVAVDEEGGDVTRLEVATGSSYPGNLALGTVDDTDLTREVATALGTQLAAAGVDLDLGPVADVNSNPLNPVIGVRSFGSDPALVARHTVAFVTGLQHAGVAACAKHFPGHGDTDVDSHRGVPVMRGELGPALEPFRAAIGAGVRAIMTGHVVVPAVDDVPATVSAPVLTGLLRRQLGFGGAVITDGLEMAALSETYGVRDGAVRALTAGADALCVGGELADAATVDGLRGAILAAVHDGRLTEARLAEASTRLRRTRIDPLPATGPTGSDVGRDVGRDVGMVAARRAIRADGVRPLSGPPVVVQLDPEPNIAAGAVPWGPGPYLADAFPTLRSVRLEAWDDRLPELLAGADSQPVVVVVRDLHRHRWMADTVAVVRATRPDAVVVEMGLPARDPVHDPLVCTFGAGRVNAQAAAEVLLGARVPT